MNKYEVWIKKSGEFTRFVVAAEKLSVDESGQRVFLVKAEVVAVAPKNAFISKVEQ